MLLPLAHVIYERSLGNGFHTGRHPQSTPSSCCGNRRWWWGDVGGFHKINVLENAVVIKRVASGQSRLSETNTINLQQRRGVNGNTRRIRKNVQKKRS